MAYEYVAYWLTYCTCVSHHVQLENWSSPAHNGDSAQSSANNNCSDHSTRTPCSAANNKHIIQLPVPMGQISTAIRLIRGMYQPTPIYLSLSQQQLLQLLLLADRFEVPKVQVAVFEMLNLRSLFPLEWEIVVALLDLPSSISSFVHPSCKEVVAAAEKELLLKLGDLEAVWADEELYNMLLQLPHAVLLQLLQHKQTQVANEATVVYTILQWWDKQQQAYQDQHVEQLKQLMQQVRMQHLSQLYICTVMLRNETVLSCFSKDELAIASLCTDSQHRKALHDAGCPELKQCTAWTAEKRPDSKTQPEIRWNLPLSELRSVVEDMISSKELVSQWMRSAPKVIQGLKMQIKAKVHVNRESQGSEGSSSNKNSSSSSGGGECEGLQMQLGLHFQLLDLPEGAVCEVTVDLEMEAVITDQLPNHVCRGPATYGYGLGVSSRGYNKFIDLGLVKSWQDVESVLRRKDLVHPDGCVHINMFVHKVA